MSADLVFVLLGLGVATALLARRFATPPPVLFAVVGLATGLAWHHLALPWVRVPPDLVLFAFLPPLLANAAYGLPLRAFRRNLLPIGLLAIGLVLLSMAGVALVAHWLAALPWAAACVLGAIVAPPDPVTATTIAGRTGLPHRLVVILEGEGLVNDAVAIVAYGVALDAATGGGFAWTDAVVAVLREVPLGVATGLVVGWGAQRLRRHIDSISLEVGVSLLTPYLAYHLADRMHGSGVLAVVTLGFVLRHYADRIGSPAARLAARTVWGAVRFASTGLVFLLLGLLVGEIVDSEQGWAYLRLGLAVTAAVIAVRLLWMHAVPALVARLRSREAGASPRERTVLGWAGMRGVVSLALALALPDALPAATRAAILSATTAVILGTLVLQGASILPLIRWLGVGDPSRERRDERLARVRAKRAGLRAVRAATAGDPARRQRLAAELGTGRYGVARAGSTGERRDDADVLLAALDAQQREVTALRAQGRLGEALSARLEAELDIDSMSLRGESGRLTGAGE